MPGLRGAGVVLVAALMVSIPAGPAIAEPPLERAKTAIDQSDYFSARSALDEALRSGSNKPDELAEIYRLGGYVAGALGDAKAAKAAFERCLTLAPNSALPAGTAPKIIKSFVAAQEALKAKKPLEIKTETTVDPPAVTIEVVEDPLKMIVKVQATFVVDGKPEDKLEKDVAEKVTIELPKGKRIDLRVAALDEHGNQLAELGSKSVPIVIVGKGEPGAVVIEPPPPKSTKPVEPYEARPLYLQWWLWGGASVVFVGLGGYFGVSAILARNELQDLGDESGNHPFDRVKSVEDRARRNVLLTNIGLIAGGAFAVTAGVLYLTRPKQPTERRMAVTPSVDRNAAGVVLGGTF
jgi:tetratricopeptide (TPR) repeat protein